MVSVSGVDLEHREDDGAVLGELAVALGALFGERLRPVPIRHVHQHALEQLRPALIVT